MKKVFIIAACLIFLTGCSQKTDFNKVIEHYTSSPISGRYVCEADFGEVFTFVYDFAYENGSSGVTIVEPEQLQGLSAVTDETGINLVFDDVAVRTYLPESYEASPVSAISAFIEDIKTGNYTSINDGEVLTVTFEKDDYVKKAEISKEDFALLYLEIFKEGDRIITISLQ